MGIQGLVEELFPGETVFSLTGRKLLVEIPPADVVLEDVLRNSKKIVDTRECPAVSGTIKNVRLNRHGLSISLLTDIGSYEGVELMSIVYRGESFWLHVITNFGGEHSGRAGAFIEASILLEPKAA